MIDDVREVSDRVSPETANAMQLFTGGFSKLRNAQLKVVVDAVAYTIKVDAKGKVVVMHAETPLVLKSSGSHTGVSD